MIIFFVLIGLVLITYGIYLFFKFIFSNNGKTKENIVTIDNNTTLTAESTNTTFSQTRTTTKRTTNRKVKTLEPMDRKGINFVSIDFETATSQRNSACECAITIVENNIVKETKSWLIKHPQYPTIDNFNRMVHGIAPSYLTQRKEFDYYWKEIKPYLEGNLVVAHNASFDLSVLRQSLDHYQISYPSIDFTCTYLLSKRTWKDQTSYSLEALCQSHNIMPKYFEVPYWRMSRKHRAGDDSLACAELAIKLFKENNINSVDDFLNNTSIGLGKLSPSMYSPFRLIKERELRSTEASEHNPDNYFYKKNVVFTGKLLSMERDEAHFRIESLGGIPQKGVNKQTNVLVVGIQSDVVGEDGLSSKQEKAIKYKQAGQDIEMLSEEQFLMNLG